MTSPSDARVMLTREQVEDIRQAECNPERTAYVWKTRNDIINALCDMALEALRPDSCGEAMREACARVCDEYEGTDKPRGGTLAEIIRNLSLPTLPAAEGWSVPDGMMLVPREKWMGCIAPLKVGDMVKVKYRDGSGRLTGKVTKIWELPHAQAQVENGWCFHANDEILEHEPAPPAAESKGER